MDEFGDWIYIILMVVVAISSLFKSISKKKEQQPTQMPVPKPSEQSYPVPPVPVKKSRRMPPPMPKQSTQPYSSLFASSGTIAESIKTEIALMPEQESALADELDLTDAEAFRKAVIYSEIINRKY